MKFTVEKDFPYHNVYNVRLHWETKEKIKKVLYWSTVAAGAVGTLVVIDSSRKNDKKETPTE